MWLVQVILRIDFVQQYAFNSLVNCIHWICCGRSVCYSWFACPHSTTYSEENIWQRNGPVVSLFIIFEVIIWEKVHLVTLNILFVFQLRYWATWINRTSYRNGSVTDRICRRLTSFDSVKRRVASVKYCRTHYLQITKINIKYKHLVVIVPAVQLTLIGRSR